MLPAAYTRALFLRTLTLYKTMLPHSRLEWAPWPRRLTLAPVIDRFIFRTRRAQLVCSARTRPRFKARTEGAAVRAAVVHATAARRIAFIFFVLIRCQRKCHAHSFGSVGVRAYACIFSIKRGGQNFAVPRFSKSSHLLFFSSLSMSCCVNYTPELRRPRK